MKVQILQYSRRKKWEKREVPDCKSSGSRIEISVIKKNIFLTKHNDGVRTVIRKASVSSFLSSSSVPGHGIWTEIPWSTEPGLSFFSNLTVSGGNIMLLVPVLRSSSKAMLFYLETAASGHAYWNKVAWMLTDI